MAKTRNRHMVEVVVEIKLKVSGVLLHNGREWIRSFPLDIETHLHRTRGRLNLTDSSSYYFLILQTVYIFYAIHPTICKIIFF